MTPGKKLIRCRAAGCDRRRRVAATSGAKYCRWHSVERARQFGKAHPRKCGYLTGPKQRCGERFVPLHKKDNTCEKHALPLSTEHAHGTCAQCGREKRLYLSADWCTACLRAMPAGKDAPPTPTGEPATAEPAALAPPKPQAKQPTNHVQEPRRISPREWAKRQKAAAAEQEARNPTPHPSDDALAQSYGAAKNLDD